MMNQIFYILVYKLSRFGRNAADILNSLEFVQSYGINLICIEEGIKKIPRQNGKLETWSSHLIRQILDNPVYCGKIAYGRRTREKVKGTKNEYKQVHTDDSFNKNGQRIFLGMSGMLAPIAPVSMWKWLTPGKSRTAAPFQKQPAHPGHGPGWAGSHSSVYAARPRGAGRAEAAAAGREISGAGAAARGWA